MRKILITLLSTLLIVLILPVGNNFDNETIVYGDELYPISCPIDEFEVSYIENDGSLTKVECRSHYANAINTMKTNPDYVVRHANSYSPTKIVAMNSGLAYSYPARSGDITMNLYQNISKKTSDKNNYKYTYITDNYEMTYYETLSSYEDNIKTDGKGFVKISMNGFDGYCELEYVDLVPSKYLNKNIAIYVGGYKGGECSYNYESPYEVICHQNYYAIEKNGNYYDLVFHYFCDTLDGKGKECYSASLYIDNAKNYLDAGMSTGVRYYSNDGINFYSDKNLNNFVAQVYGYYQYMSLRTKTNIPAKTFNSFLTSLGKNSSVMLNEGQSFIDAQNQYGSNALMIFAMACQESGYGESNYAKERKNLFGWGAFDSDPDNSSYYDSVKQCINQQMGRNLNWFMDCTNYRYAGTSIGNKGTGINLLYCSDPYWGAKIAAIAYKIDKFNNGNNGNLTDYNLYSFGVVDANYNPSFGYNTANFNTPIYTSATGNNVLYNSRFNNNYQKDLTVSIVEKEENRYKINIANPIINGELYIDDGIVEYDWDKCVGYIDCNRVNVMNTPVPSRSTPTYEGFVSLRSINLSNNSLNITGIGGIQGIDYNSADSVVHEIVFVDANNFENKYTFVANDIDSNGYNLNDGYNYKFTGFSLTMNLPNRKLPEGSYYVVLRTTASGKTYETNLRNSNDAFANKLSKDSVYNYRFTTNSLYNYRLEFDMFKNQLDFSVINKPSTRTSLVSFDEVTIDDDGLLTINAHGMIYYLNYDNPKNIEYNVYLLKDDGTYIAMDTVLVPNLLDYKKQFDSTYNMDNISFKSTTNLKDVDGTFNLILKIKNGKYIDFVEFVNRSRMEMPSKKNKEFEINILTSNIRNRLYITCKNKIGE